VKPTRTWPPPAYWTLGSPLVCRLMHLKPGTPAFGSNIRECQRLLDDAKTDHEKARPRREVQSPLFGVQG
jgi:hypothetical protein